MIQCLKHKAKERPEKRRGNKVNELRPPHLEQPGQRKKPPKMNKVILLPFLYWSVWLRYAGLKDVFLLKNHSVLFHSWKIAPWFPQLIAVIYNSRSAAALPRRQESAGIDWMDLFFFFFHRSAHAAVKSAERKGLERQRTRAWLTANGLNRYQAGASPLHRTQQTNSDSGALLRCSSGDNGVVLTH